MLKTFQRAQQWNILERRLDLKWALKFLVNDVEKLPFEIKFKKNTLITKFLFGKISH